MPVGAWPRILVNACVGVMLAAALGEALLLLLLLLLPQPATIATAPAATRTTTTTASHLAFFMLPSFHVLYRTPAPHER